MVSAVVLFAFAAWQQYDGYRHGGVTTVALVLTLCGVGVLTVGGWLGGALVFVYGTRVLGAGEAVDPPVPSELPRIAERQPMS